MSIEDRLQELRDLAWRHFPYPFDSTQRAAFLIEQLQKLCREYDFREKALVRLEVRELQAVLASKCRADGTEEAMTLPNDVSRCTGRDYNQHPDCRNCLRRTAPMGERSPVMFPPKEVPCPQRIANA